jgi:hypothetical protein
VSGPASSAAATGSSLTWLARRRGRGLKVAELAGTWNQSAIFRVSLLASLFLYLAGAPAGIVRGRLETVPSGLAPRRIAPFTGYPAAVFKLDCRVTPR